MQYEYKILGDPHVPASPSSAVACFSVLQQILFRKRFMDFQTDGEILRLIDDAVRSWTTGQYDDFQQTTNGYLK